jgi:hypothetical protein
MISPVHARRLASLILGLGLSLHAAEPPPVLPNDAAHQNPKRPGRPDRSQVTSTDRQWWAFQPLQPSAPPAAADATVSHPVDAFLRARLSAAGLRPNPPADRRRQLRRAAFDLLGMPPSPEAMDAFLQDTSPDAWPRAVARLLADPRHGERWARHWLDVARFAESSGFEHDYDRPSAFHYRDFVIKALNADMPYDQFVRWQVAGDEFEPGNPLAMMATGFLGAGVFPTQITANEVERTRYDAMDDMLSTTASAVLGLTVGCARCHDHKFDPIPTQDYYRLLSTFTTTVRSDIELDLDPDAYAQAKQRFEREHTPLVAARNTYEAQELPKGFAQWLAAGAPAATATAWEAPTFDVVTSEAGATLRPLGDGSFLAEGTNADSDRYTFATTVQTAALRAVRVEALAHPSMTHGGPGRAGNGNIGLSRIRVFASAAAGGPTNEVKLTRARATFEQNNSNLAVASALDDNPQTGWAVDPQFGKDHAAVFEFERPLDLPVPTRLSVVLEFQLNTRHNIGRPRLTLSAATNPGLTNAAVPALVASTLDALRSGRTIAATLTAAQRTALLDFWKPSDPGWRELQARIDDHAARAPKPTLTRVLICGEGYPAVRMHSQGADFFPETHQLARGSTDQKRGVATPGFLQVLGTSAEPDRWRTAPPKDARFSGRRAALARWLTDVDHGAGQLVARVIVNRLWQYHFGQGLVATPNDFGAQGTKPSHPELLDWLAAELIRSGWRLKPIHQLLLTSDAYRQASTADPDRIAADPSNALLSRWTPRRLEAEAIRDSLLHVSGVLDTTPFGPGTLDPGSRRRSIYFTVKRSQMIGAMQAFDAPEPLVSQGFRPTTTVAPQALWLMNNPHVRTWAARFARRIDAGPTHPFDDTVNRAYTLALNRAPTATELSAGANFLRAQTERHRAAGHADARERALTDVAQVVLSLNEFIYAD